MGFRFKVISLILLAIGFGIAAYFFAIETPFWLMSGWMILFLIICVFNLVRIVDKSNRELTNFLLAIKQNDFTNTYPQIHKKSKKLYYAFNTITKEFIRLRSEKESNYHFLKTVVEHSGVPLLAYGTTDEQVTLVNQSFRDLFGIPHLSKLGSLDRISSDLLEKIRGLRSNDKVLVKVDLNGELIFLSIVVRELVLQGVGNRVIAFHNINNELDQRELESWQKLIRVLTHEIKNSVIPISTLAQVINEMFEEQLSGGKSLSEMGSDEIEDLKVSLKTIEKRSKGLVKFVMSYGDLANVPKPDLEKLDLIEIIHEVLSLEKNDLSRVGVTKLLNIPKVPVFIQLDREMIVQVLINIIKNSLEAFAISEISAPKISISIEKVGDSVLLKIQDNGPGMSDELRENIFIPFFTTKKEGSGIGLSYSKQIMRAHNGNIYVKSQLGEGATFEIRFNT